MTTADQPQPRAIPATLAVLGLLADTLTASEESFRVATIGDGLTADETKQVLATLEKVTVAFVEVAETVVNIGIGPEAAAPFIERFRARLFFRTN